MYLSLIAPRAGALTTRISLLTNDFITEMFRTDKEKLQEYIDMLERDPVARACADLKALRVQAAIGEYEHSNKYYQEWIRKNLNNIEGSFNGLIGQLCSAMPLGFAVAEIVFDSKGPNGLWRLKGFNILDPRRLSVAGKMGEITHYVYNDGKGNKKWIPAFKCLHIVNGSVTNFNERLAYGSPECKRAINYYKMKQIVLTEMSVAAKNNATGILVGKVKGTETVQLIDESGRPKIDGLTGQPTYIPAAQGLMYQLQNLENSSIIVTDKENDINAINIDSGESFWTNALQYIDNKMMLAFGVPSLVFNEGSASFGNAALSQGHRSILDSNIQGIMLQIRDQMVEKVIKPLLWANFGEKYDFGSFAYEQSSDPAIANARVSTLISAIASGIFSAQDPDIQAKLRDDLGLPPLSDEKIDEMKQAQEQQKEMEMFQQQVQIQQLMQQQQDPNQNVDPNAQQPQQ